MSDKGTHSYSNRHRMHEANDTPISDTPMSATPRTDEDYRQLEVAIYDLKTKNNRIRKDLDEAILLNQAVTMLAGSGRYDKIDALIKAAKGEGYDEGRIEGHELGYSEGYEKGRIAGYDQAINEGYEQGFREGLAFKGKP